MISPALTIWQPWADLIMKGIKTVETRTYPTKFRGRFYIHAAKITPKLDLMTALKSTKFCIAAGRPKYSFDLDLQYVNELPHGVILGSVELVDVMTTMEYWKKTREVNDGQDFWREFQLGNLTPRHFMYILKDPENLPEPIPARGQQRFGWDCSKYLNKS